ncbi:MAG: hypothetical protein AAFV53_04665 [Myxococcota bacterium]
MSGPALIAERLLGDFQLGGLRWAATRGTAASRQRAFILYRRLAGQGFHHLPFFLIADLNQIIEDGPEVVFASDARRGAGMVGWSAEERALRLRYENQICGRLLLEPNLSEAFDLMREQRTEGGLQSDGFAGRAQRLMELLLRQFAPHYPRTPRSNPAHLRILAPPEGDAEAAHARFVETMEDPDFFSTRLRALVDGTANAVPWSQMLLDEDRFELANYEVLREEAVRIGCRQIIEVSRRLGEVDPRGVFIADEGEAETAFLDESQYPAGGLAGLTNRGSMENLVLSELVYIDRQMAIDLFDLRFLEGELLFYLRDDGLLRRKRRTVHLILDADASMARKPMGYDVQLSILLQGLLLRLVRDLVSVFSQDALTLSVMYLFPRGAAASWKQELSLMRLLLDDLIGQGLLTISGQAWTAPGALLKALQDERRKTYAMILTTGARAQRWRATRGGWMDSNPPVYAQVVSVEVPPAEPDDRLILPADGADQTTLSTLKDRILGELVGMRR